MSFASRAMSYVPEPNYGWIRRELLLALEGGKWTDTKNLLETFDSNSGGIPGAGPGPVFSTLDKLKEEKLIEAATNYQGRGFWRISYYGQQEIEHMGAANV